MAVGPDWLQFKHAMDISRGDIIHSPKGTTWKDHKYIKKSNGRYYYTSSTNQKNERKAIKKVTTDKDGNKIFEREPTSEVELADYLQKHGLKEEDIGKVFGMIISKYGTNPNDVSEAFNDLMDYMEYDHGSGAKLVKAIDDETKKKEKNNKSRLY